MRVDLRSLFLRWRTCRFLLLAAFLWFAGSYWHPDYGFTGFLQIDAAMQRVAVPAIQDESIYIHRGVGSYDGGYYAQLATSPGLKDPALRTALDDPGYRARRVLLSAIAWVAGGGDPVAAARAYAWINVILWFVLAWLLWRIFPGDDARSTLAWLGLLLGAGVFQSVRWSVTDLATLALTAGTVLLLERGRSNLATGLLGLAGLTRETGILGTAALVPGTVAGWRQERFLPLALRIGGSVLPLLLWLLHVRGVFGPSRSEVEHFAWPLAGWARRWAEILQHPYSRAVPRVFIESLCEHVALTVQLAYLLWRRRPDCPWWRVGAGYAVLCIFLGTAVWHTFPNAASRVLLPLTLIFNVRAVRDRAALLWLIAGNLSVVAGFNVLASPRGMPHELPVHHAWHRADSLETDARWTDTEWTRKHRWAWCAGEGGLILRPWPHRPRVRVELQLRGITPRDVEVWHAGTRVWQGRIGDRPQWITLPELPAAEGRLELELRSTAPPGGERLVESARQLSFACFGARVVE